MMAHYDHNYGRVSALGRAINRRYYDLLYRLIKPSLSPECFVMEIGPGRGDMADRVATSGAKYIGVDESPHPATAERYDIYSLSVPPVPSPDKTIDVVIASAVLEHVNTRAEAWAFVRECARVLKPGGSLVLMVPVWDECHDIFYASDYTHGFPTSPYRIKCICNDAGLTMHRELFVRGGFCGYAPKLLGAVASAVFAVANAVLPDGVRYARSWTKLQMLLCPSHITLWVKE